MALVTIFHGSEEGETLRTAHEISSGLARYGIEYERWEPAHQIGDDAPAEDILNAYAKEIEELKTRGGYVIADLMDVNPTTPGLDGMLAKFSREHWHDEDEVRFVIAGHGVFHIHSKTGPVLAIQVEAGDLIRVPRGTLHWFNLCGDRRIRAIRLFQDTAGWTPHYTESQVDEGFLPVCFGATHLPYQQP